MLSNPARHHGSNRDQIHRRLIERFEKQDDDVQREFVAQANLVMKATSSFETRLVNDKLSSLNDTFNDRLSKLVELNDKQGKH
jgi:hypothetical protein